MSFEDQLNLLTSRGMQVSDDEAAINYLDRIGYYRLSGYWYPFRTWDLVSQKRVDDFKPDTQFENIVNLYVFDKKLRLLALDALERIEVAIRVDIAHLLGERDTFAYQNNALFDGRFVNPRNPRERNTFANWQTRYGNLLSRSKESFITHYRATHGLPLPIWVAIEIWDFGSMSMLYAGMKGRDRDAIAKKYQAQDGRVFRSWLRSLNYLRNLCAHHSRLWNRNMVEQATLPDGVNAKDLSVFRGQPIWKARPFIYLCILQWLMKEICPHSSWGPRLKQHLLDFPTDKNGICSLDNLGCPNDWENWNLWQS